MTNDIKISREQLERWTTGRVSLSHLEEMRALLAAPVVERQEPVEWRYRFTHHGELSKWSPVDSYRKLATIANDPSYEIQPLYTSPPAPVSVSSEFGDPYQGAREDLSIWKRRALEAEAKAREQDQIIVRLGDAINAENGPTHMGEPVVVVPTAWIKSDVAATLRKGECCYAFGEQNPKGSLIPLYASPEAWKLPEPHGKQSNLKDTQYAMGWNACLNKVKELNQ